MLGEILPKEDDKKELWILGGILAVFGVYEIIWGNKKSGFAVLGLGIVFMAATNEEFRKQVINFFFSIFKGIYKIISQLFYI